MEEPKVYEEKYQPKIAGAVVGMVGGLLMVVGFVLGTAVGNMIHPLIGYAIIIAAMGIGFAGVVLTGYLVMVPIFRYMIDSRRYAKKN